MTQPTHALLESLPTLPIRGSEAPLYMQIAEAIRGRIHCRLVAPGDPLPSLRQLSAHVNVNPLTVSKAYQRLAADGLVTVRRGIGCYVNGVLEEHPPNSRMELLEPLVDAVVEHARLYNLTADETMALLQRRLLRDG
jgi:GntR family transcriptional regulator